MEYSLLERHQVCAITCGVMSACEPDYSPTASGFPLEIHYKFAQVIQVDYINADSILLIWMGV